MKTQHASLFSYNLTRPYPYWWFTPVTLVAAFALTAVFSYLNYAANGFELVVTTSSDPNGTIADLSALHGLPRLLTGKYRPNCQPVSLAAGSKFFTNSTGLKYEILKVSRQGSTDILPALTYSNNVLDHCMVTKVELEPSSQDRTANQWSVSAFGIIVRTYATCNISSSYGPITFDILNSYDLVPETATVNFVSQNKSARASLWWGESLLSTYWIWSTFEISKNHTLPDGDSRPGSNNKISKAHLAFHPDDSSRDILDTTFMRLAWRMLWEGAGTERGIYWWEQEEQVVYASEYAKRDIWPSNWWLPAEKLAKSAYSTVLVDLGQAEWSNILLED
ncbi:hypothetical protein Slin15195_G048900 [Septoria linicola]|uniref:Uncharacterized protein n=1 Tax=Septoria linicola TaxID=215465 RepID=A0A9Q9EH87_9PEZI|nr:hypothetical protein Slin15195_G048900 [Septoria linicola]